MSEVVNMGEWAEKHGRKFQQQTEVDYNNLVIMIETITELLRTMPGKKETSVKAMYLALLEGSSEQRLIDLINGSNESLWKTNPMYYSALIEISRRRGIIR